LVVSGRIVDLILLVVALEALILLAAGRGDRRRFATIVVTVLPGICLLMALRASLTGAGWEVVSIWLALSFPAHLADFWRRPP
jgi:hypothetical protein